MVFGHGLTRAMRHWQWASRDRSSLAHIDAQLVTSRFTSRFEYGGSLVPEVFHLCVVAAIRNLGRLSTE